MCLKTCSCVWSASLTDFSSTNRPSYHSAAYGTKTATAKFTAAATAKQHLQQLSPGEFGGQHAIKCCSMSNHRALARIVLVLVAFTLTTKATASNSQQQEWCTDKGVQLESQQQYEAAVQAYQECSRNSTSGPVAAWSMYRAFNVLFHQLKDNQRALAACTAGWDAHNAPELAWCAGFVSVYLQQHSEAKEWAERAIALGCFTGSCQPLEALAPAHSKLAITSCSWEGPWDVLVWANNGLGDTAGAEEASQLYTKAQEARQRGGKRIPLKRTKQPAQARPTSSVTPRVAVGFVTAHRPAMFQRTFNSFRQRCLDCNRLVESWFVVADDFSAPQKLADMQEAAPTGVVTWLNKSDERQGHIGSLNTLIEATCDYDYLVFIEDEWLFTRDHSFVSSAIDIMQSEPSIGQVLFNVDFLETDTAEERTAVQPSNLEHSTAAGTAYVLHNREALDTIPGWREHLGKLPPGARSNAHWPHFSFTPGVWRMSAIRQLGLVDRAFRPKMETPEFTYAQSFTDAGYKTAFLPGVNCVHLAASTPLPVEHGTFRHMLERHGATDIALPPAVPEPAPTDSVRVFVGVLSRGSNVAERQVVRDTWGADPRLARVMFFTLRPASNDTFKQLRQEAAEHGDIIVVSEIAEDYYKISHSTLNLFRAAVALGPAVTHVAKTDDDCYVHVDRLLTALEAAPKQWMYAGFPSYFSYEHGFKYGFGWGYAMTMDIARHIAAGAGHMVYPPDQLHTAEDHFTGAAVDFIAQDANVSIHYTGTPWTQNYPRCGQQEVVTHLFGKSHLILCMHANGGRCCD